MFTHILIPTDGIPASRCAVDLGLELATQHGATVYALYVVEVRSSLGHVDLVVERREKEGEAAVEAVEDQAHTQELSAPVEKMFRYGVPLDAILDYAGDYDVDLIVIGKYEWTGIQRLLHVGRVAERLTREADIPALVAGAATCTEST
jgi:nucleotide-binding universal stress UspA family protein